jgi:hypothetical protein
MESNHLPNTIEELPEQLRLAIEKLIENKVEEKWNTFIERFNKEQNRAKTPHGLTSKRPDVSGSTKRVPNGDLDDNT